MMASGRAEEGHTRQPTFKAFLIVGGDDASSPKILPLGAVTLLDAPTVGSDE